MALACAHWAGQEDKEKDFCHLYLPHVHSFCYEISRMAICIGIKQIDQRGEILEYLASWILGPFGIAQKLNFRQHPSFEFFVPKA